MYIRERMVVTVAIWALLMIIMVAAMDMGRVEFTPVLITAAVGAAAATRFIWGANLDENMARSAQVHTGKLKRGQPRRVDDLLDNLSEDEIDELRARIEAIDNEDAISMDQLLHDYKRQR
ncbi:MAG: hypothetical protein ACOCZH_03265 [Phototrophicaceae bacterium]